MAIHRLGECFGQVGRCKNQDYFTNLGNNNPCVWVFHPGVILPDLKIQEFNSGDHAQLREMVTFQLALIGLIKGRICIII